MPQQLNEQAYRAVAVSSLLMRRRLFFP